MRGIRVSQVLGSCTKRASEAGEPAALSGRPYSLLAASSVSDSLWQQAWLQYLHGKLESLNFLTDDECASVQQLGTRAQRVWGHARTRSLLNRVSRGEEHSGAEASALCWVRMGVCDCESQKHRSPRGSTEPVVERRTAATVLRPRDGKEVSRSGAREHGVLIGDRNRKVFKFVIEVGKDVEAALKKDYEAKEARRHMLERDRVSHDRGVPVTARLTRLCRYVERRWRNAHRSSRRLESFLIVLEVRWRSKCTLVACSVPE
jgi:hypothetical protein